MGGARMFEEQRQASGVGDSAYLISTEFLWEKPKLTDDQLMEVTKTVVGSL